MVYSPLAGLGCSLLDGVELLVAVKPTPEIFHSAQVVVERLHAKIWLRRQLETASDLLLNAHVWSSRGVNVV